jgi:hypothetical protein
MDEAAKACDEARAIPEVGQAICAASMISLQTIMAAGRALEIEQNLLREDYAIESTESRQRLKEANHLDIYYGRLIVPKLMWELTPLHDGLRREILSPAREMWQVKYFVNWPQRLIPDFNFEEISTVETHFRPKRGMLGVKTGGFNYSKISVQKGGESETHAACRITEDYKVERIK